MKQPTEKEKAKFQHAMHELNNGNPDKAIRLFEKVRKSWRDDADIRYLEGLAYGKLGDVNGVIRASRRALEIQPDHYGALCNLANTQMLMDDQEGALENYRKALELKPDAYDILNNYGRALGLLGRRQEAIDHYRKALEYRKNYAPAHASLARAYAEAGDPEAAMKEYRTALKIDARDYDTHFGLAGLHVGQGGLAEAEHHFKQAIRMQRKAPHAYIGLANVELMKGNHNKALTLLERVQRLGTTQDPLVAAWKADCYEHMGKIEEAYKILEQLSDTDRMSPTAVAVYTKVCRKFSSPERALELVELSFEQPSTDSMQKQMLLYAAGALLDKLQRYDEAFDYYRRGNEQVAIPMNRDYHAMYDLLMDAFNAQTLPKLPRARTGSSRPIFILGMPRSGTTLTEQILSSHPQVYGAGELDEIKKLSREIIPGGRGHDTQYAEYIAGIDADKITELAGKYLASLNELDSSARFVTDKMPHNFQHIGLISLLFPDARIIHCRRNPLDNCLSIYFQNFIWSHDYATDLGNIGLFYSEYDRLMQHWEKAIDMPIMTVQYEDMIADHESMARKVLDFCGLDWDESVMKFYDSRRAVATASYDQVRKPIYRSSQARWKHYRKHIDKLIGALPQHSLGEVSDHSRAN